MLDSGLDTGAAAASTHAPIGPTATVAVPGFSWSGTDYLILVVVSLIAILATIAVIKISQICGDRNRTAAAAGSAASQIQGHDEATGKLRERAGFSPEVIGTLGSSFQLGGATAATRGIPGGCIEEGTLTECVICLGDFQEGEDLRQLHACGHAFHKDCVDAWLGGHQFCPLCRTSLAVEEKSGEAASSETQAVRGDVESQQTG